MEATEPPAQSILDEIGTKLSCTSAMRLIVSAWLAPAVGSLWVAGGSVGLWRVDADRVARALELSQAAAVLLAITTPIVAAIWAVRTWPTPNGTTSPTGLMLFAAVAASQLTLGWLPVVYGADGLPPLMVAIVAVHGVLLATSAAAAVRIVPQPTGRSLADATLSEAGEVSQAPVRRSLPEPAVGH